MLLGAAGMALLTQVTVTSSYASGVLPGLLILGLGFGLIFSQVINTATAGVARRPHSARRPRSPSPAAAAAVSSGTGGRHMRPRPSRPLGGPI